VRKKGYVFVFLHVLFLMSRFVFPLSENSVYCWLKKCEMFQVDEMYREAPIKHGMFDYIEFTRILKHGAKDKDDQ